MVRGILYYLIVWITVSAILYGYNHLSKRGKMTVFRIMLYGLLTATVALGIVLLIVYIF
jgi:Na+/H+-dicarboxylate symporter